MKTIIAVCGSSTVDREAYDRAFEVGLHIALNGCMLVCGGLGGVMEASCSGAKKENGLTIGILPTKNGRDANRYVDIPIVTGMGHARNVIIVQTADSVIALPGGAGTHSEIALSLKTSTPVVALDAWEHLSGLEFASSPEEAVSKAVKSAERTKG